MSQRFEGRNLEDALQQAAQTLGVDRWQLTYHVLLEKRGFLGGVKRIVIEADKNESAPPPAAPPAPAVAATPTPASEPSRLPRTERAERRPARGAGGGGGGRGRGGRRREAAGEAAFAPMRDERRRGRDRRHRRDDEELQTGDFEKFLDDVPAQGEQSEGAKLVADWCGQVIALSRLELVARTEENDAQIHVKLYGPDARRLVDQHGELLDAIQVLANKALVGRKVEKEIELDSESFKDRRVEELRQQALAAAERVRADRREELLPAMTPIERRIVHLALQEDPELTTESRGDGFYKRVAIIVKPTES